MCVCATETSIDNKPDGDEAPTWRNMVVLPGMTIKPMPLQKRSLTGHPDVPIGAVDDEVWPLSDLCLLFILAVSAPKHFKLQPISHQSPDSQLVLESNPHISHATQRSCHPRPNTAKSAPRPRESVSRWCVVMCTV